MSFETALTITNQKTIKDKNKDKLNLCFMVKIIENEFDGCQRACIVCVCILLAVRQLSMCI